MIQEKKQRTKEKNIINDRQLIILVILIYIGTSIAIIPGSVTAQAKQDAWIGAILGTIGGLLVALLYNKLAAAMKNQTIVEYMESVMGKVFGKIVGFLFIASIFLVCATQLWIVGDFLLTNVMPETPAYATHILFAITIMIGTRLGIEVVARSGEIVFPWIIISTGIMVFTLFPEIQYERIQPIFASGIKPILKSTLTFMGSTSLTLIIILMIFPVDIDDMQKGKKAMVKGVLIGGVILICVIVIAVLVLGADITSRSTYPTYTLAKNVRIGEFLERIEVVFAAVWFISVFYKVCIYFYGAVLGLSQLLGLQDYRRITLPMGMVLVSLSIIVYPNIIYAQYWDSRYWVTFSLIFYLFLPLILLVMGKLKKK